MITEQNLRHYPDLVKALTGLEAEQVWALEKQILTADPSLQPEDGIPRSSGRPYAHGLILRLTALLMYLRTHITQALAGLLFGLAQEDLSRDLRRLLPLIQRFLPCPTVWTAPAEAATTADTDPSDRLVIPEGQCALVDATEQRVQRPQDTTQQAAYYSGKKKGHTLKTQLVCDDAHRILAISEAVPGAMHDKALADHVDTGARLPTDREVLCDKGYQGLEKGVEQQTIVDAVNGATATIRRVRVLTPVKKPHKRDLGEADVVHNHMLGRIRVRIEHCIGWVKNWAIMTTRFRCSHTIYTAVMQTVCGMVNAQTARWQAKKHETVNCA